MNAAPRAAINQLLRRAYSQPPKGVPKSTTTVNAAPAAAAAPNVTGLTSACVKPTSTPVGPGASATSGYKVPEYFCFNRFSYAEAEVEMAKYRCPQPSALRK
ncbi:hypothetical protein KR093_003761 [Drosophila rubida]|uniref:NADH dehydrogenase [ubiquinone] flavoprotein 3, mitochondrial n=1 Tax=Drosophila rubida TaxID=30044 RepID=A0AAD4KB18_9MUSC|nr:hypothetical protein KR093_003761 [Drosophila rubida]